MATPSGTEAGSDPAQEPTATEGGDKKVRSPEERIERIKRWTAILGVGVAVLTLTAGALGLLAAQKNLAAAEAKATVSAQSSAIATLTSDQASNSTALQAAQSSISALASQNSALLTASSSLQSRVDATTTTTSGSTTTPTTAATAGTIRNSSPSLAVVNNSKPIDLDQKPDNPQWIPDANHPGKADIVVMPYGQHIVFGMNNGASKLILGSTPSNYDSCRAGNPYTGDTMLPTDLTNGEYLCIKTDEGRYAALQVLGDPTATGVTFKVETYNN